MKLLNKFLVAFLVFSALGCEKESSIAIDELTAGDYIYHIQIANINQTEEEIISIVFEGNSIIEGKLVCNENREIIGINYTFMEVVFSYQGKEYDMSQNNIITFINPEDVVGNLSSEYFDENSDNPIIKEEYLDKLKVKMMIDNISILVNENYSVVANVAEIQEIVVE